jgi:hypothetical protein
LTIFTWVEIQKACPWGYWHSVSHAPPTAGPAAPLTRYSFPLCFFVSVPSMIQLMLGRNIFCQATLINEVAFFAKWTSRMAISAKTISVVDALECYIH